MKDIKRIILIAVFSMFAVATYAQDSGTYTDAVTAYNKAQEMAQASDYESAISLYEEAISIADALGSEGQDIKERSEKAIPKIYYQIAVAAYRDFQTAKTIESLNDAIIDFNSSFEVASEAGDTEVSGRSRGILAQLYYQKATMLFKREDFTGADEALNQAINTNSNYAKAYYQKGLVQKNLNENDVDAMLNWFDQAINVANQVNDGEVVRLANDAAHSDLLFRGSKAIENGRFDTAIDLLERSLEYNSNSADSYYRLAEAANKKFSSDAAIGYAQKALGFEQGGSTDKAKIYFELGMAYQAKGNKAGACEAFTNASYGSFKAPSEHKMEYELKCESAEPSDY